MEPHSAYGISLKLGAIQMLCFATKGAISHTRPHVYSLRSATLDKGKGSIKVTIDRLSRHAREKRGRRGESIPHSSLRGQSKEEQGGGRI